MELYSSNQTYKLFHWNMLDMSEVIENCSIDSVITDPPYELNFMGKGWDNSWIAFQPDTWKKCLDALKPWGYLLAFWWSRTYHRIACAIEDAGFEIRDCIMWLYGSGFPKSMNIWLAIDKKNWVESIDTGIQSQNARPNCDKTNTLYESGTVGKNFTIKKATNERAWWWTSLKPSYEPIIVARKPCEWSCTDNVIKYGVGWINIDECRVQFWNETDSRVWTDAVMNTEHWFWQEKGNNWNTAVYKEWGRFPANTILTYDDSDFKEVCDGFPNNEQRYYYTAKASKRDRDEWLNGEWEKVNDGRNTPIDNPLQRWETLRKNTHPTVKPTDLMQYLVRLVTPNGWTVLDPFNWSGSTWKAVMYENKDRNKNYKYIWIELTEEYLPIAKARIEYVINKGVEKSEQPKEQPLFSNYS